MERRGWVRIEAFRKQNLQFYLKEVAGITHLPLRSRYPVVQLCVPSKYQR